MKAAPTLDGRIRIDVESPIDLLAMQSIVPDARLADRGLTERLSPGETSEDWKDYVMPELGEGFESQLGCIERAVSSLDLEDPQPLFIVRDDAESWYGGLNQARLALEDRHGFTGTPPDQLASAERAAWFRSQFYQRLQEMILQFLMLR